MAGKDYKEIHLDSAGAKALAQAMGRANSNIIKPRSAKPSGGAKKPTGGGKRK